MNQPNVRHDDEIREEAPPLRGRHFRPASTEQWLAEAATAQSTPTEATHSERTRPEEAPTVKASQTQATSKPTKHTRRRPHRRRDESLFALRSLVQSPIFAYAAAAFALTAILFAATIPVPHYTETTVQPKPTDETPAKPRPENDEYVEPREIAHPFEGTSAEAVSASNAFGVLTQAIGEFEDTGDKVSFAVRDLTTGNTLTYDSGRPQYPASSIKAPYTCAVYELLLEKGETSYEEVRPLAEETILESSDEAYRDLHERYGMEVFSTWLQEAGVAPGEYSSYGEMLIWNYPHLNTDQLLAMWLHICDYLQTDTPFAQHLGSLLEAREVSAMRNALGTKVKTQSKMGWFDYFGDFFSEPATVEAGIVYAPEGAYAVAVMTTAPAQIAELEPIFTALARAHYEMI